MNSSASAAQVFLKNDYDDLMSFFKTTWRNPSETEQYEYRVYLAQKCFNLNEFFFFAAYNEAESKEKARLSNIRETFVAQTGLVMQAKKLARCYREHQRFPRILICDELLKTGHDYMDTVMSVSRAVADELFDPEQDSSGVEARILSADLLDAIDFYSYMHSGDDELLLTSSCQSNLHPGKIVPASKWVAFVQNSSASIVFSGKVENTSFIPSFWISQDLYNSISKRLNDNHIGWARESWNYWNKNAVIWQRHSYNVNNDIYLHQAIRCSFHPDTKEYSITPYLFWNALNDEENERLYTRIAETLRANSEEVFIESEKSNALENLINILLHEKSYAKDIKSQLILSLGSILLFCGFIEDGMYDEFELQELRLARSDLEKVSECFGTIGEIFPIFQALLSEDCAALRIALWDTLRNHLLCYAEPLCADNRSDPQNGRDAYLLTAAKHLLAVDANQQKVIQYRRSNQINYDSISRYYEADGFLPDYLNSFPSGYTSLNRKIGALLILVLWSVTGFTIRRRVSENAEAAKCSTHGHTTVTEYSDVYLNVGESTQIVRAMYMLRFVPALTRIEEACKRDRFSPRNMVFRFGCYLDNKLNSEDYANAFLDFYDWCKETGRSLSDWNELSLIWLNQPDGQRQVRTTQEWNGGAWPAEVRVDTGAMTMTGYLRWERMQQVYFLQQASYFMPGKN